MNDQAMPLTEGRNLELKGYVYLVEDDDAMRESMQRVLSSEGYWVYAYADPLLFLDQVVVRTPCVVVLDMRMPGLTGLEVQEQLLQRGLPMPTLFVSGQSTVQQAVAGMENGATRFLVKPVGRTDLLEAVAQAMAKDTERDIKEQQAREREARTARLTPREREVLALLLQGYGNTEIGKMLDITYATAKQYKTNIMMKLNVQTNSQLIAFMKS